MFLSVAKFYFGLLSYIAFLKTKPIMCIKFCVAA